MTEQAGSLVTDGVPSLEVRWIFPGSPAPEVTEWFARFPARAESRVDTYLLDPPLPGLSVKVRGGAALEVKRYRGSPGTLEVAGCVCGRLQAWQKWSFPLDSLSPGIGDLPGWQPVAKRRRISRFPAGAHPEPGRLAQCEVELTEFHTRNQHWWTLGFEATGPADLLGGEVQTTAALVFAPAMPGVQPGLGESSSYAEWLGQRLGTGVDASAGNNRVMDN